MRTSATDPTIGVSCGHRVPRLPELVDGRKLYWCGECGEHRMSGGKPGSGGHEYLLLLRDLVQSNPLPIVVDDPGTPFGRATVLALGGLCGRSRGERSGESRGKTAAT